jgi:hypothetical protein
VNQGTAREAALIGALDGELVVAHSRITAEPLRTLYQGMVEADVLTSVSEQLLRIVVEEKPGWAVQWDARILSRWLVKHAESWGAPFLIFSPLPKLIWALNELIVANEDAEPDGPGNPDDVAVLHQETLCCKLACSIHPFGNRQLEDQGASETFAQSLLGQSPHGVVSCSSAAWPLFLMGVTRGLLRASVSLVQAADEGYVIIGKDLFHGGVGQPLAQADLGILSEGLYSLENAERLARRILQDAMGFEGSGGKVLILHANDPAAVPLLACAKKAASAPQTMPLDVVIAERMVSKKDRAARERGLLLATYKSWGLSHREIASHWLETGLIQPAWTEGPDEQLESAKRQVRRMVHKLWPSTDEEEANCPEGGEDTSTT